MSAHSREFLGTSGSQPLLELLGFSSGWKKAPAPDGCPCSEERAVLFSSHGPSPVPSLK